MRLPFIKTEVKELRGMVVDAEFRGMPGTDVRYSALTVQPGIDPEVRQRLILTGGAVCRRGDIVAVADTLTTFRTGYVVAHSRLASVNDNPLPEITRRWARVDIEPMLHDLRLELERTFMASRREQEDS